MKEIYIKNQKEFDKLPKKFKEYTRIYLKDTTERVYVNLARENSSVVAWENSSVVAWGNSSVVARENSSVEARENSSVEAWENSVVRIFWETVKVILHGFSVAFLPVTINLKISIKKESKYAVIQKVYECDKFGKKI